MKYDIPGVRTHEFTKIIGVENIEFGHDIIIDDFTFIFARSRVRIGSFVHLSIFSSITASDEVELGDYVAISQGCRILSASDDFKDWGMGNSTIDEVWRNVNRAPVRIGRFCIVGANSVVLPGVSIGEGVSVGACSVVTRDLAPWGIYVGNKRIGERNRDGILETHRRFLERSGRQE